MLRTLPGMSDLDTIKLIEKELGLKLKRLDHISCFEKSYTLDENGNVDGLSLYGFEIQYLQRTFEFLKALSHLKLLELMRNQISDIGFLQGLPQLQRLNLSSNQISDISVLAQLDNLQELCLSNNSIGDIEALKSLTKLHTLDLFFNHISDIEPLRELRLLKTVYLSHNSVEVLPQWITQFDTEIAYQQTSAKEIFNLYENPIKTPPLEIVKQGKLAIGNYFEQIAKQGKANIYEAKLMLVGEPGAGKTTLLNKLFSRDFPVPNTSQQSTMGIDVRQNWRFGNGSRKDFKAHIWDFGGQQIQYMLHQFFLTSDCVYVLMAEKRRELSNFDYWLNIINLLGKNSPVVVLFNEINFDAITSFIYDEKKYRDLFPNLDLQRLDVNFAQIDDGRFDVLLNNLKNKLSALDHMGNEVPARWIDIRLALDKVKEKKHIRIKEYFDICTAVGVDEEPDQMLILKYFHLLGIVLHFNDDDNLCDTLFLDPNWTVDAVYSILSNQKIEACHGIIAKSDIEEIWRDKGYDFEERAKLLQLMLKDNFELCYKLPVSQDKYIMPSLMSTQKPPYEWFDDDNLQFRFQYPFMPKGIVSRLIVRLNRYVDEDKIWQEGVVFTKDGVMAEVTEQKTAKEGLKIIAIRLRGNASERKDLLTLVREEIKNIQSSSFSNLPYVEMVPCCCSECSISAIPYFFDYSYIENYLHKGKTHIDCRISTEAVNIPVLVGSVFNLEEIETRVKDLVEQSQSNININLSNIGNTQTHVEQHAQLTATQTQTVSIDIKIDVKTVQGLFNNLKEDILDEIDIEIDDEKEKKRIANELKKAGRAFEALEEAAGREDSDLDSATKSRLKEFVSNLADEDSRIGKTLGLVSRGREKMQAVGKAYNSVAPYFVLPSIPPPLLGDDRD